MPSALFRTYCCWHGSQWRPQTVTLASRGHRSPLNLFTMDASSAISPASLCNQNTCPAVASPGRWQSSSKTTVTAHEIRMRTSPSAADTLKGAFSPEAQRWHSMSADLTHWTVMICDQWQCELSASLSVCPLCDCWFWVRNTNRLQHPAHSEVWITLRRPEWGLLKRISGLPFSFFLFPAE